MLIRTTLFLLFSAFAVEAMAQTQTEKLVEDGLERLKDNQSAQSQITKTNERRIEAESKYLTELKVVEGLNMYNDMLARQLQDQNEQINKLNTSINNATLVERQIMPLLSRMLDALETFIEIDVPFLTDERLTRVADLRTLLRKSEYTTSEKCRRIFEAYQIENEFGYTIESYKGRVSLADQQIAVDFLRIGRIALLYRDLSGEKVGFWNKDSQRWEALSEKQYQRHITKGLKIAREEISPELITIPLLSSVEAR